ncbi:MAG: DUF5678 domain-containing protein [Boseongicola sp.]|nr:DUF5678 domain-containing protein [Boseongicola sp.]
MEPYALANSRPPALPAVPAEPNLLQRLHPLSGPRRAAPHFGRVEPVLHCRPDLSGALRQGALPWDSPDSAAKDFATSHGLRPALELPWPRVEIDTFHGAALSSTARPETGQTVAARDLVDRRITIDPFPGRPPLVYVSSSGSRTPDTQPFLLIERVKQLLDQQRIRDARRTLAVASNQYPESRQIAGLLRAIAPGQVSPTSLASPSRERETAWIRQHGHKYRGKWIALDEDRLIAFAGTLNELLAGLDASADQEKPPFIQHLHPG